MFEFTGLLGWSAGAQMQPHSDNNRDYLKQRDYTAILYLNSSGPDFKGGSFHFCDSQGVSQQEIIPQTGRLLVFESGMTHKLDLLSEGSRYTVTVWFTLQKGFNEDTKYLTNAKEEFDERIAIASNQIQSFSGLQQPSQFQHLEDWPLPLSDLQKQQANELGITFHQAEEAQNQKTIKFNDSKIYKVFESWNQMVDFISFWKWKIESYPGQQENLMEWKDVFNMWISYKQENIGILKKCFPKWIELGQLCQI